jgi:Zn-dependent peptidase ImmA (M78 family)
LESPGAQAFTLAHELGHVVLGESAISGAPRAVPAHASDGKRIENWCNHFAAAFLMPREGVLAHVLTPDRFVREIADDQLNALADAFAVSRHAMLIRLVTLGRVSAAFYWRRKRPQFLAEEASFEQFGRPPYYGVRYRNAVGDVYTSLVFEALGSGRIQYQTAADYMGIKNVKHLLDIMNNIGR